MLTRRLISGCLLWVHAARAVAITPEVNHSGTNNSSPTAGIRGPGITYLALGDRYSVGIGAGLFYPAESNPKDGANNNKCGRMAESYPVKVKQTLGAAIQKLDFMSCAGNVLDNIDEQVRRLNGEKYDTVSLSISGNDFMFGTVIEKCVYAVRTSVQTEAEAYRQCDKALADAQAKIRDETVWEKYRSKLRLIQAEALKDNGHTYVTAYNKFFSKDGHAGDKCERDCFLNAGLLERVLLCAIKMRWPTRQMMNRLVDEVNARIQAEVERYVPVKGDAAHFIRTDDMLEGRRFCDPAKRSIWGDTEEDVQFFEIGSSLEERGEWEGPPDDSELLAELSSRGIFDRLQQWSVFHPKKYAHEITATLISLQIIQNQVDSPNVLTARTKFRVDSSVGSSRHWIRVPDDCVVIKPGDNTVSKPLCERVQDAELEMYLAS